MLVVTVVLRVGNLIAGIGKLDVGTIVGVELVAQGEVEVLVNLDVLRHEVGGAEGVELVPACG